MKMFKSSGDTHQEWQTVNLGSPRQSSDRKTIPKEFLLVFAGSPAPVSFLMVPTLEGGRKISYSNGGRVNPVSLTLPENEASTHLFPHPVFIGPLLCVRHCARL